MTATRSNSLQSGNHFDGPVATASSKPVDSNDASSSLVSESRNSAETLALLLDLSGDTRASETWAAAAVPGAKFRRLDKAELKRASKREALAAVRAMKPTDFLIFTSDMNAQSGRGALMVFAILSGARRVSIGDRKGNGLARTRLGVLFLEAPRLALELLAGYALIVPLSWLLTEGLGISLAFRAAVRASRRRRTSDRDQRRSFNVLYVRATLSSVVEGGMHTHVSEFAAAAAVLGHRLKFLVSGARPDEEADVIQPSSLVSGTRTLFELWNNLVFTVNTLRMPATSFSPDEFDFIYQRYSRFNWTGVALSVITGLPLLLEYNGSEVWISGNWDPIGQLWLLKRFERVNQRAADLVFVVSEVERSNLIDAGVNPAKIIVNPNGVDPDHFCAQQGGAEIRRSLGIEEKIVVGFVGTFGPWHGAPVLAQAATQVDPRTGCHFLFVGDGDERVQSESLIEAAAVSATFTGRVPHERVPAYLDACDILVSPHVASSDGSEFFGSPTKLFEYMAMGKAIVASRLGQIAGVIIDGGNGLLVEPADPTALARAIDRLARDRELRARLGAEARDRVVTHYTWKQNAARVFEAAAMLECFSEQA